MTVNRGSLRDRESEGRSSVPPVGREYSVVSRIYAGGNDVFISVQRGQRLFGGFDIFEVNRRRAVAADNFGQYVYHARPTPGGMSIVSNVINAAQARKSTTLLVSMMMSVCLRLIEMCRKTLMTLIRTASHGTRHSQEFGAEFESGIAR